MSCQDLRACVPMMDGSTSPISQATKPQHHEPPRDEPQLRLKGQGACWTSSAQACAPEASKTACRAGEVVPGQSRAARCSCQTSCGLSVSPSHSCRVPRNSCKPWGEPNRAASPRSDFSGSQESERYGVIIGFSSCPNSPSGVSPGDVQLEPPGPLELHPLSPITQATYTYSHAMTSAYACTYWWHP